jgi:hypothetical protein
MCHDVSADTGKGTNLTVSAPLNSQLPTPNSQPSTPNSQLPTFYGTLFSGSSMNRA